MSLIALPLLSALTSFAFEPSEGGDYEVPKGITDILPRMAHLRRFEVRYCAGWEDEAFSVGRTVPSLRTLIIDREWCNHRLTDQELGNLQHLESPIDFWGELVLSSKSARALSLSTLRELRLSDAENLDTGMVEYKYYAQLIEQHLNSTPAPAPVSLEVLTFTLPNTFDDPLSWLPLLRAFRSPPSLHEVAFEQTSLVEAPNLAPWELLRLPQARKLSLKVPGYRNPDKMNAALPFSVILSSFPQLKSLTLDNVFALDRVESTICVPAPPQDTPLQQLLYFVEGETEIETVDLREDDEKRFVRCRRDPGPVGGFIRELWHSEL
ncbi:hypothetical protein BCR35DRAFT_308158 [Leucosporidium creatinivorum]|uniref:Proteophosphoglycan ppg4 n=1 Tax=Leucosporidium creatinivorum TaxID=106004 RepID=A0A1Y2ECU9_9BASI|nr:hypothetical protein BCR35DRAFT_308158 [Leucosporidium creatinivorum]